MFTKLETYYLKAAMLTVGYISKSFKISELA